MSGATVAALSIGDNLIPNPVDWANISGAGDQSNADQTISGITSDILLKVSWTITLGAGPGAVRYNKNGGPNTGFGGSGGTFSVSPGDTIHFTFIAPVNHTTGLVTVANNSTGDTTLDTFTYDYTP